VDQLKHQSQQYEYNRRTHRFLVIQMAVARFDESRELELAAKRALRALRRGDTTKLDPLAARALDNADGSVVLYDESGDPPDEYERFAAEVSNSEVAA
jgi:hypothetical protein